MDQGSGWRWIKNQSSGFRSSGFHSFNSFFSQVERILDSRRTRKGKVEYLVRWRGYSSDGDTWEPESHLSTCMNYVQDFNRQRDATLMRSTRSPYSSAHRLPSRPPPAACRSDPGHDVGRGPPGKPVLMMTPVSLNHLSCPSPVLTQQVPPTDSFSASLMSAPSANSARRSLDLSKSGIKILVPKSPMNPGLDSEESPSEAAHSLEASANEAHLVPPEVALLEKPAGVQLGPGEERARMGTRPRNQNLLPPPPLVSATPAAMCTLSGSGESRDRSQGSPDRLQVSSSVVQSDLWSGFCALTCTIFSSERSAHGSHHC